MAKIELGLIFGGKSLEHHISVMSARSIANAVNPEKYNIVPILITPQGQWLGAKPAQELLKGNDPVARAEEVFLASRKGKPCICSVNRGKTPVPLDVAFPALHGPFGEDGTIQGLFEMIGLPYVGSGVLASALAMDKGYMKEIFARHNLPQTDYYIVEKEKWAEDSHSCGEKALERTGFPAFVKPAALGSSVGITKVIDREQLFSAVEEALGFGKRALVERGVSGREFECSVLGNNKPKVAGPGEVISRREFYDYQAKYTDGEAELIFNPDLPERDKAKFKELALLAFQVLGCRGLARIDFFFTPSGKILINELNTIPGFTQFSMYPKLWMEEGMEYSELIDRLISLALNT